jgi:hypothetical protein
MKDDPQKKKIPPKGETPFDRFERLVQKVVTTPKQKTHRKSKTSDETIPLYPLILRNKRH